MSNEIITRAIQTLSLEYFNKTKLYHLYRNRYGVKSLNLLEKVYTEGYCTHLAKLIEISLDMLNIPYSVVGMIDSESVNFKPCDIMHVGIISNDIYYDISFPYGENIKEIKSYLLKKYFSNMVREINNITLDKLLTIDGFLDANAFCKHILKEMNIEKITERGGINGSYTF